MYEAAVDHCQLTAGEAQDTAEADLHTEAPVDALLGGEPHRFGTEGPARDVDAVAAHVHQRPALQPGLQSHIQTTRLADWIDDVAERGAHEAWFADGSGVQQGPDPRVLRVVAPHECFHQQHAGRTAGFRHAFSFGGVSGQRLLAEDVLTGLGGAYCPLRVQTVWKRNVDSVDVAVFQESRVGTVRTWDIQIIGERAGGVQRAAADREDLGLGAGANAGDEQRARDPRGAQDPPAQAVGHYVPSR